MRLTKSQKKQAKRNKTQEKIAQQYAKLYDAGLCFYPQPRREHDRLMSKLNAK